MFHQPAATNGQDPASPYKTKIGGWMFWLYAIVYGSFVGINLVQPTLMEENVFMGLNLAVAYGFVLIIFALILALVYNHLCTAKELESSVSGSVKGAE